MHKSNFSKQVSEVDKKQDLLMKQEPWNPVSRVLRVFHTPRILQILWIAVIILFFVMLRVDGAFKPQAPCGIISFELNETVNILHSWNPKQKLLAAFSLGLDYFYIALYTALLSRICIVASRRFIRKGSCYLGKTGIIMSWLVIVAALLDSLENYFLLHILLDSDSLVKPLSSIAADANVCAKLKFILLGLILSYIFVFLVDKVVTLFTVPKNDMTSSSFR